jgi:DNA-directed RNA polymerase subunit RPC12/RpoP
MKTSVFICMDCTRHFEDSKYDIAKYHKQGCPFCASQDGLHVWGFDEYFNLSLCEVISHAYSYLDIASW